MQGDAVNVELNRALKGLGSGHDALPFMTKMSPPSEMKFVLLPDAMLALLVRSGDYRPIAPGEPPSWFNISSADDSVTLILYRALSDEQFYVLAPIASDIPSVF